MYKILLPLKPAMIERFISPYDIFNTYIDHFPGLDVSFQSQLRNDDQNPSCRVSSYNDKLYYKDFSRKGVLSCYEYVMEKFGLTYMEALEKIRADFGLDQIESLGKETPRTTAKCVENPVIKNSQVTLIFKKKRDWTEEDMDFWNGRYGITKDWLEQANIEPISDFWLKNHKFDYARFVADKHSYAYNYYWHENVFRRKIYQPFSQFKWISNVDSTIVQGWDLIPKKGDTLIITSSFKDVGTIQCNLTEETIGKQIYAIAPNNEETFIPKPVFDKLKSRWNEIILWYNNDFNKPYNTGRIRSEEIHKEFGIRYLLTPDGTEKDPSDYRHHYGKDEFIRMTMSQLNGHI